MTTSDVRSQSRRDVPVLIVGAGPAGMVSALCLAARGVSTLVVERQKGVNEHPKAHELNARSIEILNALGITDDQLAEEASPESDGSRILFCKSINEEFGRIDLLADGACARKYERHFRSARPYLNLSQTELERVLARRVEEEPLIEVLCEHEWQSCVQRDARVFSEVRRSSDDEVFEIESRYLLGADGAGSPVRKFVGIEMEGPEKLQDFINVYFEHGLRDLVETPAKLYWILHPAAPGAFIAHHLDKRWTYNMPLATPWEQREDYTEEVLRERICTALGFDPGIEIKSVSYWRMTVQIADRYREGNVFLVGDSCHRFPPTGGLGMNTGIADAHNLAWKLAAVLDGTAEASLLDSYEAERRPVAQRNAHESATNYQKIFEVIEAFGLSRDGLTMTAKLTSSRLFRVLPRFLRRLVLGSVRFPAHRLLGRFHSNPKVRDRIRAAIENQLGHFDRIGLDIGYVYQRGALFPSREGDAEYSVTEYEPSSIPGSRFPHVSLNGSPDGASSHDLIDYSSFALITGTRGDWPSMVEQLSPDLLRQLKVVSLDELEAEPAARDELRSLCRLGDGGALLIRPDGHVAWRGESASPDSLRSLEEVAEHVGLG